MFNNLQILSKCSVLYTHAFCVRNTESEVRLLVTEGIGLITPTSKLMKSLYFSYLRVACFSAAAFLFASLLASAVDAADPKLGSPEEPMIYEGLQPTDTNVPDGHLQFSPDVQNIQIYRSDRKPSAFFEGPGYTYAHHIDLGCWKGWFYAVWDANLKDEDTLPTRLLYATSTDGFHWSAPEDLFPPGHGWNLRFYFYHASNDRMLVFAAAPSSPKAKNINEAHKATIYIREITADHQLGPIWTLLKPRSWDPPSFEECKDAGFVAACREAINNRPLLEQQDYGQLLGQKRMIWHDATNWPGGKIGGMSKYWSFGKAMCFFHRQDGTLVGLSKLGFVTLSSDAGQNWSFPVIPKGIETGTAKIWGQRTADGHYVLVYNPWSRNGPRYPLVAATSDDGITFHDMRVIHGEVPPERYQGKWKDLGPQYVRGITEWGGDPQTIAKFEDDLSAMWVIYSVNKEDIWVSRIAVPIVSETSEPVDDTFDNLPSGPRVPGWHTYAPNWTKVQIARDPDSAITNQYLELVDCAPVDYARAIRTFPPSTAVEVSFRLWAGQTNRGRLEIDLMGDHGTRPVQLVLNDGGDLQVSDGGQMKDAGVYSSNTWMALTLKVKDGKFTLLRDGKPVVENAVFAEPGAMTYAISFRTGKYRGTVSEEATTDLADTENPVAAMVYRIDDLSTTHL